MRRGTFFAIPSIMMANTLRENTTVKIEQENIQGLEALA